ncbi:TetR/AcrR family transcriptional regulator [Corallococcus macrosporus]|nr:TetR/AcrR family transcriptional regulator [Corallococcus macrosporus]
MKKKQRLTGAERRVQLMEIGRAVFASKGYEATSIEEVAQQAGVSKPIVYEHFGAKEGLYAAIVDREMDDLVARVSASIAQGTPRQRFEDAVLAFMAYVKDEPAGFAVLTRDSPTAAARRGLTRVIDDLAQRVGDVFRSEFEHAGYPSKVAPIYANALVGMVTQVGHWWAAEGKAFSTENVARHVAALGWMGLRHLPKDPVPPGAKREPKRRA